MADKKNAYQIAVAEIQSLAGSRHVKFKPEPREEGEEGKPHEITIEGFGTVSGKNLEEAVAKAKKLVSE